MADAAVSAAQYIGNQFRKLVVANVDDEDLKKAASTPEEIAKAKMDKMLRKELLQAASELRRAQSALDAAKSKEGTLQSKEVVTAKEEAERSFSLAQADAEKAYQVVDTYAEKIQATSIRVDAILGREMMPVDYRKRECCRAFKELMAESQTRLVFGAFIMGPTPLAMISGVSEEMRYSYVSDIRTIRRKIIEGLELQDKQEDWPPLKCGNKDFDKLLTIAKEANPRFSGNDGFPGKHILTCAVSADCNRLYTGGNKRNSENHKKVVGEILVWDVKKYPKAILHRIDAHSNTVTAVKLSNGCMISAALDGKLKLWGKIDNYSPKAPPQEITDCTVLVSPKPVVASGESVSSTGTFSSGFYGLLSFGGIFRKQGTPGVVSEIEAPKSEGVEPAGAQSGEAAEGMGEDAAQTGEAGQAEEAAETEEGNPTEEPGPAEAAIATVEPGLTGEAVNAGSGGNLEDAKAAVEGYGVTCLALLQDEENSKDKSFQLFASQLGSSSQLRGLLEKKKKDSLDSINEVRKSEGKTTMAKLVDSVGSVAFAGTEDGKVTLFALFPNGMRLKSAFKTPPPIKLGSFVFGEQEGVSSLLIEGNSLFVGGVKGTVKKYNISDLLQINGEDADVSSVTATSFIVEACNTRIMSMAVKDQKLYVGCLGKFPYAEGLEVEFNYGKHSGGTDSWCRAVITQRFAEDSYEVVVDEFFDYETDEKENAWNRLVVTSDLLRSHKVGDPFESYKEGLTSFIKGTAKSIDQNLITLHKEAPGIDPANVQSEAGTAPAGESAAATTSAAISLVAPAAAKKPKNRTTRPSELSRFVEDTEVLVDSSCGLVDIPANARGLLGATRQASSFVADASSITAQTAMQAAPAWAVREFFQSKMLSGPTELTAEASPTIFIWDLAKKADEPQEPIALSAHQGGVSSLAIDKNYLYSASFDKTIIVWQLPAGDKSEATEVPAQPTRITRLRGFEGALHFVIVDGGDHLYAGTSKYNIEERMLPMEFAQDDPSKFKAATIVDSFQFELQDFDDEQKPRGSSLWVVHKPGVAKNVVSALGSLTWSSLTLAMDVYHEGRCDEGQRFVDRDDDDQVVKFSKDKASKSAVAIEETKLFDDNFFSEDFDASLEELHLQEEEEYQEEEEHEEEVKAVIYEETATKPLLPLCFSALDCTCLPWCFGYPLVLEPFQVEPVAGCNSRGLRNCCLNPLCFALVDVYLCGCSPCLSSLWPASDKAPQSSWERWHVNPNRRRNRYICVAYCCNLLLLPALSLPVIYTGNFTKFCCFELAIRCWKPSEEAPPTPIEDIYSNAKAQYMGCC